MGQSDSTTSEQQLTLGALLDIYVNFLSLLYVVDYYGAACSSSEA